MLYCKFCAHNFLIFITFAPPPIRKMDRRPCPSVATLPRKDCAPPPQIFRHCAPPTLKNVPPTLKKWHFCSIWLSGVPLCACSFCAGISMQGRRNVFSWGGGGGQRPKKGTVMSKRALIPQSHLLRRPYGLTFLRSVEIILPPQYFYGYIP